MMDRKNLYFVGPIWDGLFMGGFSILVFLYYQFFYRGYSNLQVSDTAMAISAGSVWIVNHPHFAATNYRFYQSRRHVEEFKLTAYLIPFLITLGAAACFAWPKEFGPAWTKIYVLWSVYHYSGQNYGLTLAYAKRSGIEVDKRWRFCLAGFLYMCFVAQYADVESMGGSISVFAMSFPLLAIPHWVATATRIVAHLFGAAMIFYAVQWCRRNSRAIPWIVGIPVLAQYSWTSLGAQTFSFQMLVPFFHGVQYLFVAWAMEIHRSAGDNRPALSWEFMLQNSLRWILIVVAGGAALFNGLPWLIARSGYDLSFAIGVIFVSVQIHHFFVDGVIWKLRGEKGNSPLFMNFRAAFAPVKDRP